MGCYSGGPTIGLFQLQGDLETEQNLQEYVHWPRVVDKSWGALCENMQSRSAPADVSYSSDCSHAVSGNFKIHTDEAGKESPCPHTKAFLAGLLSRKYLRLHWHRMLVHGVNATW